MVPEARLVETDEGLVPEGAGWFVVNAREARWWHSETMGSCCMFEGEARFPELGINVNVLRPGEPLCRYHGENAQEDFLVLSGECVALVEGVERPMRRWDLLHCPPWAEHVIVGAGDGPCVVLAVGVRPEEEGLVYTRPEVAVRHGAAVPVETRSGDEAYADLARPVRGPYREGDLP